MDFRIETYEEFLNKHKKRESDIQCSVLFCDEPGVYKVGDSECYCGMCEEHAGLKEQYLYYLRDIRRSLTFRMMWKKDNLDHMMAIYNKVSDTIREFAEYEQKDYF